MTDQPASRYTPSELLWLRAHEHVRRAEFAQAVRLLAQCYALLEQARDPRLYEVHRRWGEVHQMYLEDGARQNTATKTDTQTTLQAQAEEAANVGDLPRAIDCYERLVAQSPQNELAKERLSELRAAKARADELQRPAAAPNPAPSPVTTPHTAPVMQSSDAPVGMKSIDVVIDVADEAEPAAQPRDAVAADVPFLQELLVRIQQRRRPAA
jgi:tetratricopeptide (TPR) repeat protein